jgi:predicted HD phosphohydrolase
MGAFDVQRHLRCYVGRDGRGLRPCNQGLSDLKLLPDRLLAAGEKLPDFQGALQVSRNHSLQSATRALRDDRDDEYVAAALLHDIDDELAPYSHGPMAAAVLKPFVSDVLCWIIEHHTTFQQ